MDPVQSIEIPVSSPGAAETLVVLERLRDVLRELEALGLRVGPVLLSRDAIRDATTEALRSRG